MFWMALIFFGLGVFGGAALVEENTAGWIATLIFSGICMWAFHDSSNKHEERKKSLMCRVCKHNVDEIERDLSNS